MSETRAPYAGRTLPAGATATERALQDEISQLRVQVSELDAFNTDLLADVATLRAGIAGLRRDHTAACARIRYYPADGGRVESCDCGAHAQNAAVDALLEEGT